MATDVRRSGPRRSQSTLEIAERCDVEIELGKQLIPRFLPEGEDERAYLRERVMEGLRAPLRRPAAGRGASSGWRWSSASSTGWASTPTS